MDTPKSKNPAATYDDRERVVESVLTASRAMVAIAIGSLADERVEITLPQYRLLVLLAMDGPKKVAALSTLLDVYSSTVTRLCDRLAARGLIERAAEPGDRREVLVSLTRRGRSLVDRVTRRRHDRISAIIDAIPPARRRELVLALQTFSDAPSGTPAQEWSQGWLTE
jgi:DNA-binding MarR family transcriptional regulator